MDQNEWFSFALRYGSREDGVLKSAEYLAKKGILPKSKNEVFRRGLHACVHLAEVDEKLLLTLLHDTLHRMSEIYSDTDLKLAKDLALTAYSIMVSKLGAESTDFFETIVRTLELWCHFIPEHPDAKTKSHLCDELEKLAISIDTMFLNRKTRESKISIPT